MIYGFNISYCNPSEIPYGITGGKINCVCAHINVGKSVYTYEAAMNRRCMCLQTACVDICVCATVFVEFEK